MKKAINLFNPFHTPKNDDGSPKPLPVIGNLPIRVQYLSLLGGVAICGFLSLATLQYTVVRGERVTERVAAASDAQMYTQRLAKNIQKSVAGDKSSFALVKTDSDNLSKVANGLHNGDESMKPLEANILPTLEPLEKAWGESKSKITELLGAEKEIVTLAAGANDLEEKSAQFSDTLDDAWLLMVQRGDDEARIMALQSLSTSMLRLSKSLALAAKSPSVDISIAASLNKEHQAIKSLIEALTKGGDKYKITPVSDPEVKAILDAFAAASGSYLETVNNAVLTIKKLGEGKNAGTSSLSNLDSIYDAADKIDSIAKAEADTLTKLRALVYALVFSAGFLMLTFIVANKRDTEKVAWEARRERDETDEAVIRLMEEIVPISEGNLAARTTVTEHVTGALADRINMMAESLQNAVSETKNASGEVADTMHEVRSLIQKAAHASLKATGAATDSKDASISGAELVKKAADTMEEARDRMQETSKRVKRLGEVSQSIGSITDLIEEMTEKTAILALNTQLKAVEAGEEGKSFRVIAEEIRKLSDEAKKSLATIRSNVQSMQTETKTVIQSIEQTTGNVVQGSRLWESADEHLSRIRESASGIVAIIEELDSISSTQVEQADNAEGKMKDLQTRMGQFSV